jgi:hypothetical protein
MISRASRIADSPAALAILQSQGPALMRLGLLAQDDIPGIRSKIASGSWAAAMAVPDQGFVFVKPDHITNIEILVHELAHVASARFGYGDLSGVGIGGAEPTDPAWVNVDGAIAGWAMEEGEAVLTAAAAMNAQAGTTLPAGALAFWARNLSAQPSPDGLFDRLRHLLYQESPTQFTSRARDKDGLEDVISRAWAECVYQTVQILHPDAEMKKSDLWPRVRECRGLGPSGGTRAGGFLAREMLCRRGGQSREDAGRLVKALMDDGILWWESGALWIVRWKDTASAAEFVEAYKKVQPQASISRENGLVTIEVGTVPDHNRWTKLLSGDK